MSLLMLDRTANLLGAIGLAIGDRLETAAREVLGRAGETAAALVVIGYGDGLSNEHLRRILGLSHPGAVRLVDRLVGDGLVERRQGPDKRSIALQVTERGVALRQQLMATRAASMRDLLAPLTDAEQEVLASLVGKMLQAQGTTKLQRCSLCRLCDASICAPCPIPAKQGFLVIGQHADPFYQRGA